MSALLTGLANIAAIKAGDKLFGGDQVRKVVLAGMGGSGGGTATPPLKIDGGFYGHYDPKVYKARPIKTTSNTKGK